MEQAEKLRYLILAIQRDGNRWLGSLFKDLHVTTSQAEVLVVLHRHGPLTIKELGSLLICEGGSPSRLVATLVTKKLVVSKQRPSDRRMLQLSLTKSGLATVTEIKKRELAFYQSLEERLVNVELEPALAALSMLAASNSAVAQRGYLAAHETKGTA